MIKWVCALCGTPLKPGYVCTQCGCDEAEDDSE